MGGEVPACRESAGESGLVTLGRWRYSRLVGFGVVCKAHSGLVFQAHRLLYDSTLC